MAEPAIPKGLTSGFRPPPEPSVDTAVKSLNGATDSGASL
jgi:hypothetical protein